jgi:hypothetical protein
MRQPLCIASALVVLGATSFISIKANAWFGKVYGALAVSKAGAWGASWDQGSEATAKRLAREKCESSSLNKNGETCAVLSVASRSGQFAIGWTCQEGERTIAVVVVHHDTAGASRARDDYAREQGLQVPVCDALAMVNAAGAVDLKSNEVFR